MRRKFGSPAESLKSVHVRYRAILRPTTDSSNSVSSNRRSISQVITTESESTAGSRLGGKSPVQTFENDFGGERSFDRDEKLARLEAVLFLAKEPLNPQKMSKFANLANAKEALTLVSRLNDLYDHSARAFRVYQVAGGWQLRTRPQFGKWLRRLKHIPREVRLSAPSMETLAVVAYRQPVLRADIEEIRGVGCGEILRQLMERDLVRVSGRSEELGRPYFYSTTQHFLQIFGLRDLKELPRAEFFRQSLEDDNEAGEQANDCDGDEAVTVTLNDNSLGLDAETSASSDVVVISPKKSNPKPKRGRKIRGAIDDDDEEWDDDGEDEGGWDDDEDLEDDYEFDDEPDEDDDWQDDEELDDDEEWVEVEDDEELDDDEEWDDEDEEYEYEDDDDDYEED